MAKSEEKLEGLRTCFEEECCKFATSTSFSDLAGVKTRVAAIRHAYVRVAERLAAMQSELARNDAASDK